MSVTQSRTLLRSIPRRLFWLCVVAGASTFCGEIATAADGGAPSDSGGGLEEIVVTATRREENLSKVPISISAYTQETMDTKGIKDFTDIVRFTPGVTIDAGQTNS